MKHVLIILDGASEALDAPLPAPGGQTPLEAARTPHLDRLARHATLGRLQTAFPGLPVESPPCIMGLLGYDPLRHAHGRAGFEALARGVALADGDLAFRCNIVALNAPDEADEADALNTADAYRMTDFSAGLIADANARRALSALPVPAGWKLIAGQSYRNLLVVRRAGVAPDDLDCPLPHAHVGDTLDCLTPRALTPRGEALARDLGRFMADSAARLRGKGLGLCVWGPSAMSVLPSFALRSGLRGAVVAGLDFMRGLGLAAGMDAPAVPGADGGPDSDFAAKTASALHLLEDHDLVCVHVNAPDEAGHSRDARAKIRAIERADSAVIGPLWKMLRTRHAHGFTLAVGADHATCCADGRHSGEPAPWLLYRQTPDGEARGEALATRRLTEAAVARRPVWPLLSLPKLWA